MDGWRAGGRKVGPAGPQPADLGPILSAVSRGVKRARPSHERALLLCHSLHSPQTNSPRARSDVRAFHAHGLAVLRILGHGDYADARDEDRHLGRLRGARRLTVACGRRPGDSRRMSTSRCCCERGAGAQPHGADGQDRRVDLDDEVTAVPRIGHAAGIDVQGTRRRAGLARPPPGPSNRRCLISNG